MSDGPKVTWSQSPMIQENQKPMAIKSFGHKIPWSQSSIVSKSQSPINQISMFPKSHCPKVERFKIHLV